MGICVHISLEVFSAFLGDVGWVSFDLLDRTSIQTLMMGYFVNVSVERVYVCFALDYLSRFGALSLLERCGVVLLRLLNDDGLRSFMNFDMSRS